MIAGLVLPEGVSMWIGIPIAIILSWKIEIGLANIVPVIYRNEENPNHAKIQKQLKGVFYVIVGLSVIGSIMGQLRGVDYLIDDPVLKDENIVSERVENEKQFARTQNQTSLELINQNFRTQKEGVISEFDAKIQRRNDLISSYKKKEKRTGTPYTYSINIQNEKIAHLEKEKANRLSGISTNWNNEIRQLNSQLSITLNKIDSKSSKEISYIRSTNKELRDSENMMVSITGSIGGLIVIVFQFISIVLLRIETEWRIQSGLERVVNIDDSFFKENVLKAYLSLAYKFIVSGLEMGAAFIDEKAPEGVRPRKPKPLLDSSKDVARKRKTTVEDLLSLPKKELVKSALSCAESYLVLDKKGQSELASKKLNECKICCAAFLGHRSVNKETKEFLDAVLDHIEKGAENPFEWHFAPLLKSSSTNGLNGVSKDERTCFNPDCGRSLNRKSHRAKYCSATCKGKHSYQLKKEKNLL
jgi:hypothetical protein